MQSVDEDENKRNLNRSRSVPFEMPLTDSNDAENFDDRILFLVEEIVQHPLPGYVVPTSLSFSPDDSLIAYLFSPDNTLKKRVFAFDLRNNKQELLFSPPDGGLDEGNISLEEKLWRERFREPGLGVTRYEWVKTSSKRKAIMVLLPAGIYIQDISYSKAELRLRNTPFSPIIDPHLSPDGSMLAYIRDSELYVLSLLSDESKQLTNGAKGNGLMKQLLYLAEILSLQKCDAWFSCCRLTALLNI